MAEELQPETPVATTDEPQRSFRHTLERKPGSLATLAVEVDPDRVARQTERVFRRRVQQARIPGFRPGKAPRALYERTYGTEHLWHEAAEDVVDETYREILELEGLQPLDKPEVEISELGPDQPLRYTATMPVRPDVTLGEYVDHGAKVAPSPVTDDDVERTIAGMREHHAELRPVERAARDGDVLTVDIDVKLDGRQLPPFGRNAHLELGRDYAVPGLAEGLVGVSAGEERTLDLTFPADHSDTDLAGKSATFVVRVSGVAEKILPSLDDEFAKTVGVGDLAALRRAVRSELAHASFHEARDEAGQAVLDRLLEASQVELPEILVHDELDGLMADLRTRVTERGLSWEQFLLQARKTEEEIRADWRAPAERRAKSLLVLDALAQKEDVGVSSTELAQEVALTPLAQQDPQALRDPAVLGSFARSIRNRKLIDKLLGLDSPEAERELMRAAGAPEDEQKEEAPKLEVPAPRATPDASPEGREALRRMLEP
ncbi:MAG: trigger factor [Candidatus Limnocylindria bacterium]